MAHTEQNKSGALITFHTHTHTHTHKCNPSIGEAVLSFFPPLLRAESPRDTCLAN